jgi:hypothetical protein
VPQPSMTVLAHHTDPEVEPSLVGGLPVSWREIAAGLALAALAALALRRRLVTPAHPRPEAGPAAEPSTRVPLRDQVLAALVVAAGLLILAPLVWRMAYRLAGSAATAERLASLAVAAAALLAALLTGRRPVLMVGLVATLVHVIIQVLTMPYGAAASVPATAVATGAMLSICLPPLPGPAQAARVAGVLLGWPLLGFAGAQGWGGDVTRARAAVLLAVVACLAPALPRGWGRQEDRDLARPPAGQRA